MQELEKKFQPRLCMMRLNNRAAVKNHYLSPMNLEGLSPRVKQIARAFTAPLLGDAESTSKLLTILREHDEEARIERSLEPEWLVTEALLTVCHEGMENGRLVSEILVAGIDKEVKKRLKAQGEDIKLGARKVGGVLKSLGLRTVPLGRLGRGLRLISVLRREIHLIAAQLGIDRRAIAPLTALEYGYGGAPCALCEEFGLTGGLRFIEINSFSPKNHRPFERGPLLAKKDVDNGNRTSSGNGMMKHT